MTAAARTGATEQAVVFRVEDEPEIHQRWGKGWRRWRLNGGRRVVNVRTGEVFYECLDCTQTANTAHGITIHRGWMHRPEPEPELGGESVAEPERHAPPRPRRRAHPDPEPAAEPEPMPLSSLPTPGAATTADVAEPGLPWTDMGPRLIETVRGLAERAHRAETERAEWRDRALNAEAAARMMRDGR